MSEMNNLAKLQYFVKKAVAQLQSGDSCLYAFIERRRSGKSMTALAMCKMVDPDFDVDKICFTSTDLREKMREYTNSAILFDEAGVTAYSRDFMTELNKLLNKELQVFGFKQLAVLTTFQHINMIDKQMRELVDTLFLCKSKIKEIDGFEKLTTNDLRRKRLDKVCWLEPYAVSTNWLQDPIVVPYKIGRNGRFVEIGEMMLLSLMN